MARVIVIGVPGDSKLYVADLDAGTVQPLEAVSGALASASSLRANGATVTKGVDFAVAVKSGDAAAAGLFDA